MGCGRQVRVQTSPLTEAVIVQELDNGVCEGFGLSPPNVPWPWMGIIIYK